MNLCTVYIIYYGDMFSLLYSLFAVVNNWSTGWVALGEARLHQAHPHQCPGQSWTLPHGHFPILSFQRTTWSCVGPPGSWSCSQPERDGRFRVEGLDSTWSWVEVDSKDVGQVTICETAPPVLLNLLHVTEAPLTVCTVSRQRQNQVKDKQNVRKAVPIGLVHQLPRQIRHCVTETK